ncbi:MAG TPA: haloalkane dehalogenase [Mycobacteriales bacterium]
MTEVRRTPDARFDGLPDWPYEPRYTDVDGLRLARVDEGAGPPVVLLHGEPTWGFLYRNVIPRLVGAGRRVVVPDAPGFGRSDKPVGVEWYSYESHSRALAGHLAALDLRDVTLVVQDWGGPLGLRWAMENAARVARLVVLNTGLFSGRDAPPGLKAWLDYARTLTDLDVGAVVSAACGGLAPEVVRGYDAPFPDASYKAGALAFPRLVPTSAGDAGAREQAAVRAALDEWDGPVSVAFSDGDPIFPAAVGEAWARRLRRATFTTIEGAGHFVQEMRPEAVVDVVLEF